MALFIPVPDDVSLAMARIIRAGEVAPLFITDQVIRQFENLTTGESLEIRLDDIALLVRHISEIHSVPITVELHADIRRGGGE